MLSMILGTWPLLGLCRPLVRTAPVSQDPFTLNVYLDPQAGTATGSAAMWAPCDGIVWCVYI